MTYHHYAVLACLASISIGIWIGWQARSLKARMDQRTSITTSWDQHQRALDTMSAMHRRVRVSYNTPPIQSKRIN